MYAASAAGRSTVLYPRAANEDSAWECYTSSSTFIILERWVEEGIQEKLL